MLSHPYVLDLLKQWKLSDDQNIPKDLLALLVHNKKNVDLSELCNLLYNYKVKKQKRNKNLKNLKVALNEWFTAKEGMFKLINNDNLSTQTIKLLNKKVIKHSQKNLVKDFYENIDAISDFHPDYAIKIVYKLLEKCKNCDINFKKVSSNIENILKVNNKSRESINDSSILNFVTKREKTSANQHSMFHVLPFDNSVYLYNLKNPNYNSLRRRKDLVNPVKKIFIKLSTDFRPPIYRSQKLYLQHRNSLKRIFNIDYEEDSTWEDDEDGESIRSEDSDNEDEDSENEEWVEEDSDENDNKKNQRRPMLTFPKIKCVKNEAYTNLWDNLPLISEQ